MCLPEGRVRSYVLRNEPRADGIPKHIGAAVTGNRKEDRKTGGEVHRRPDRSEIYSRFRLKYRQEKEEITKQTKRSGFKKSNLSEFVEKSLQIASQLKGSGFSGI
jgi:hypothetical protein